MLTKHPIMCQPHHFLPHDLAMSYILCKKIINNYKMKKKNY